MEKEESKYRITYTHSTEYRGEEIGAKIIDHKSKDYLTVSVYTPVHHDHKSNARFHKSDNAKSMREAKRIVRTHITEATTDIDRHLSEVESLDDFFESVDESVDSLEGKFEAIEEEFNKELDRI